MKSADIIGHRSYRPYSPDTTIVNSLLLFPSKPITEEKDQ